MKTKLFLVAVSCLLLFATTVSAQNVANPDAQPHVEVVFVLDSTGSMGGLIAGAKETIWSIANEIILQKPTPEVRMGLLTYRDKGDEYVTKMFDITDDIDAIYGHLQTIRAAGGGDEPESVNQALYEAVNKMEWSPKERKVYRVIFLVGDAPPHMDYQDDVKYPVTCEAAVEKGIIINTIQVGNIPRTTPFWKEIAQKTEGEFVQMALTGNVRVIETPFDREIAAETQKLNSTIIAYGDRRQLAEVAEKVELANRAAPAAQAARGTFNFSAGASRGGSGQAVQGRGDLLFDLNADAKLLEKTDELPEVMQKMTIEERETYVAEKQVERDAINKKIGELAAQRAEWLRTEGERQRRAASDAPSFDKSVSEMIQKQWQAFGK